VTGDNGAGLRALFYGLCCFHGIDIWAEDQIGQIPADFYLPEAPWRKGGFLRPRRGIYVIITPEPADRQLEINTLQAQGRKFIILDREDLSSFRDCGIKSVALERIGDWADYDTHGAVMRRSIGLPSVAGS